MNKFFKIIVASLSIQTVSVTTLCSFKLGVENLSPRFIRWLSLQRIGLITNQTGCDQGGKKTADILRDHGIKICMLLAPEHGINGTITAEGDVRDSRDEQYSLPIISLYGNGTGKHIAEQVLHTVDTLIFDIQDSGMRHYTYISTLFYVLEAAARHKKTLIIFDRPNPLGRVVEGPLMEMHLKSFIGIAPIPLRHGMTIGELAHYFNNTYCQKRVRLHIIPMSGYQDSKEHVEKCFFNLSPNIQTLNACYGYSFLGLLGEIRPFDIGIGTPWAFQCIMLPQDLQVPQSFWSELRKILDLYAIQSSDFTYYSTRKKKNMVGVRIMVRDIYAVSTCALLAAIVSKVKRYGIMVTFSHAFDKAIGTERARESLQNPMALEQFIKKNSVDVQTFCKNAYASYLYRPLPICISSIKKTIL